VLRIGVNALYLIPGQVGGTEIYLRSLLAALAKIDPVNRYIVFTSRETGADLIPAQENFGWAPQPVSAASRPARLLYEQTALPVEAARRRLDVLFNPGFTAPVLCPCRSVTVFHDLQHKRHPEHFRWFDLPFWRLFLFLSACASERLIAVSEATRRDLLRYYPVRPEHVRTVPQGVDEQFFVIAQNRDPEPMLLCVSTLHPHKNIERLLRAFARFHREQPRYRLVLAGLRGFHTEAIERLVVELQLGEAVQLTGWLAREHLYDLYRRADAFIYPSTFEGFGLPVLEALAAGIPTACSAIEPLAGIAGDAALLFPPSEEDSIVEALRRLTSDAGLRARLRSTGPARAAEFSWEATAKGTLEVLEEVGG